MKKRYLYLTAMMLLLSLLTGCGEGARMENGTADRSAAEAENTVSGTESTASGMESAASDMETADSAAESIRGGDESDVQAVSGNVVSDEGADGEGTGKSSVPSGESGAAAAYGGNTLEARIWGNIYQIENWSLYKSTEEAGISEEHYREMGDLVNEMAAKSEVLLVRMKLMATPDIAGEIHEDTFLNNFRLVTREGIENAYLPEREANIENRLYVEPGSDAMYLDIGTVGDKSYFKIDTPPEGESISYTVGYLLSEAESEAARAGELYLHFLLDDAQRREDLQLLYLDPEDAL